MIKVEEGEVAVIDSINDSIAPGSRAVVTGRREPRGIVGIEVTHDNCRSSGVQEKGEIRAESGGARGGGGDVNIDEVDVGPPPGNRDALMFSDTVTREEASGGEVGELKGVMDEYEQTTTPAAPRAVTSY